NGVAITLTELQVTVAAQSSNAGCEGPANLALTQSNVSASNPLVVPANGHVSLPSGAVSAPQVLMKDLPTNQDACKNVAFASSPCWPPHCSARAPHGPTGSRRAPVTEAAASGRSPPPRSPRRR